MKDCPRKTLLGTAVDEFHFLMDCHNVSPMGSLNASEVVFVGNDRFGLEVVYFCKLWSREGVLGRKDDGGGSVRMGCVKGIWRFEVFDPGSGYPAYSL